MPHIHELIDFVVSVYIVHDDKVLLVHHKGTGLWLPIGGHIELNEDPEEALFREVKEECGLDIEIIGTKPVFEVAGTKSLFAPSFLNIHLINETHRHVVLIYLARARSEQVALAAEEHYAIRWFTSEELDLPEYKIKDSVKYYARAAFAADV